MDRPPVAPRVLPPIQLGRDYCATWVAGILLVGNGPILTFDGAPIIDMRAGLGGKLILPVTVQGADQQYLAVISRNEWLAGDPDRWQTTRGPQLLRLRLPGQGVAVEVDTWAEPAQIRVRLWRHGHQIDLRPSGIRVDGSELSRPGWLRHTALAGMTLAVRSGSPHLGLVPYQGEGAVIADTDLPGRLHTAVDAWRTLAGQAMPV